jgi:hypothetical protein
MKIQLSIIVFLMTTGQTRSACVIHVPGTASPYLAGLPIGTLASVGAEDPPDVAPGQSPVLVADLLLQPGTSLTFSASGHVSHCPAGSFCFGLSDPDGARGQVTSHWGGPEHGIADVVAPFDALVGVFLGSESPDASAAPAPLDFSTPESLEYLVLSPQLKQVFFIGDGATSLGATQQVVVPAGATRLFLGTIDLFGWANNVGGYSVSITSSNATDCPASSIRVSEVEVCWPSQSNTLYTLEYRSDLTTNTWLQLSASIVADSSTTCVYDKVLRGEPQRFYRVVAQK